MTLPVGWNQGHREFPFGNYREFPGMYVLNFWREFPGILQFRRELRGIHRSLVFFKFLLLIMTF